MKKLYILPLITLLAVSVLFVGAQAQQKDVPHHWNIKVIPHNPTEGNVNPDTGGTPPAGLYGIGQGFVTEPEPNWVNTDGSDEWPCFGTGATGTGANPDCPTLGDQGGPFPGGAAALGTPAYVFYLQADSTNAPLQPFGCDASTTADVTNYCGQTNTWYEDWSGDTTDELLYIIEVTQNGSVIADSGTVDFGPNPYGTAPSTPAADVVIYGDQNFGTDGVATGPNNGNCEAAFDYPLSAPAYPGVYVVPAGKTCVNPVASSSISGAITAKEAKFSATTEIGTPAYTKKTSGVVDGVTCTVAAPCYEVKWTIKYKASQSWYIWLR